MPAGSAETGVLVAGVPWLSAQTGQAGSRATGKVWKIMRSRSSARSRSSSGSPQPVTTLIASMAARQPTVPENGEAQGFPLRVAVPAPTRQARRLAGPNDTHLALRAVHGGLHHRHSELD